MKKEGIMRDPWFGRRMTYIFLSLFLFLAPLWGSDYSLKGRHFDYLSIDASKFDPGQPYEDLRGSVVMHWSENLFYFIMRVLDNECWSPSPGNLCNYKFLGIMLDPGTWTHHDAGPLRTKPLEQCPQRDKYLGACVDCIHEGAVGSSNYWYIPKDPMSKSGIDLYIMSNGDGYSWDGNHGGSKSIYSGLSNCKGHCSGTCSGYSCCYCDSAYEYGGNSRTEGYYCFPGDDQAIYVDINHLYFSWTSLPRVLKADGTYETLRDSHHTPPYHRGYTLPGPRQSNGRSCYNYPKQSPCTNVWDGADITKFGFCTGPNSCGDYPADSIFFKIHMPDVYAELGIDAGDLVGRGGGYIKWDYFDISAYMKVFFWDNTNDGVDDPDALDMDIQVTSVDLDGSPSSDFDLNLGLGTIVSLILPLFTSTLENLFQGILNNTLKNALAGALPINMNNLLGNPWNLGKGLLDVALYGHTDVVNSTYSSSTIYRVVNGTYDSNGLWKPSTYTNCALDIKIDAAAEPILFNADCSRDFDLNNPESTDFFGVCTLYNSNGTVDEDQQFDDDSGPTSFGPPLKAKSNTPPVYVRPPALDSLDAIKYGVNTWGYFRTVMYDANHNGIRDDGTSNIYDYDMALSIHENFLRQALYAAFASGIIDFEITPYDENGDPTPFKDFLKVDVWKSLIPVLGELAKDDSYVEIKLVPRATPDARVGLGTYPTASGPGAGMTGKFDIAFFFPSLDFEFWYTDKYNVKRRIMVLRWNLTAGFDLEFHKGCSPQDPYYGQIQCNPAYDYLPDYVPGYIMFYGEINSPSLINDRGITPISVVSSEIDVSDSLLKDQFSNIIPVLMSSYVQFYLETRFRLVGLTFDLHYSGPDGPNGKWYSLYFSMLGNINVFQLLGNISLGGATPADLNPDTLVNVPGSGFGTEAYLPASYVKKFVTGDDKLIFSYDGRSNLVDNDNLFYTYRIDGGLWHPITREKHAEISTKGLLDGKHIFEVASLQSYKGYTWMDYTPAKVEFIVDRTPPEIKFLSSGKIFEDGDSLVVATKDMTDVEIAWSIDGNQFSPWTSSRIIPLDGLESGTHRVVVKARDEAGNVSEKGLVFEIKESSTFGCSNGGRIGDFAVILLLAGLFMVVFRRRRTDT